MLRLLLIAAALLPALPARALPVACSQPGQERSPLRSLEAAARFYFDRPAAQLPEQELRFLQSLVPGLGPCALRLGQASLAGQPGQLLTLTYPSGRTVQAFCRPPGLGACQVRSAGAGGAGPSPGPWQAGALLPRPPAPEGGDRQLEIQQTRPRQVLAVFQWPAGLAAGLPPEWVPAESVRSEP